MVTKAILEDTGTEDNSLEPGETGCWDASLCFPHCLSLVTWTGGAVTSMLDEMSSSIIWLGLCLPEDRAEKACFHLLMGELRTYWRHRGANYYKHLYSHLEARWTTTTILTQKRTVRLCNTDVQLESSGSSAVHTGGMCPGQESSLNGRENTQTSELHLRGTAHLDQNKVVGLWGFSSHCIQTPSRSEHCWSCGQECSQEVVKDQR